MKEREISLIDLVLDMLSHWRGFVAALVAGALLLGGLSYVKSVQNYKLQLSLAKEEQEMDGLSETEKEEKQKLTRKELEEALTEEQQLAVQTLIDDEQEYALREEYMQNSIYYQMDPLQYYQGELVYKMEIADMEASYMLGIVYEDLLNSVGLYQFLEEETDIPARYVRELVSVDAKTTMTIKNGSQTVTMGNDSMKIVIVHAEEEGVASLLEGVKAYIAKVHEDIEAEMGAHELLLLSEVTGESQSTSVMNNRIAYYNTNYSLLTSIAKTKAAFTEEQVQYYELLSGNKVKIKEALEEDAEEESEEDEIVISTPSVSVKYIALGAVLFVFAYAMLLFMVYILNEKLRASDELQMIYDISQLGTITQKQQKQCVIDRWITALRHYGKRAFTREQSLELATAAVKMAAVKNGLDHVCLAGCDMKAGADVVCDSIKKTLQQEQLEVTVLDNVLYDVASMEKLRDAKAVVLVEKAGSTLYTEIAKELELFARQEIKVLGGIVVE